ncbi:MAG: Gfo/Idh/MocA family oxidoreductase [Candidatus Firestonebacteria bacterium]
MEKVRFGIVGAGNIAPFHIHSIRACKNAEVVAIADTFEAKAKQAGEEFKIDAYGDAKKMFARKDIDVVTLCVPSGLHMQLAIEAMEAGKHVIAEKPIEVSLEKIDRMIETSKKTKRFVSCILQSRFFDNAKRIKEDIAAGKFGKLILGDMYNKWYRSPEYFKSAGWRATWELDGGGALMNQAVHGVDLLLYFMGEADSVNAYCETLLHSTKVEDTAVAIVKFKNGALGVIEGTTSIYPGSARKLEIQGTKGTAVLEDYNTLLKYEFEGEPDLSANFNEERVKGGFSDPTAMPKDTHAKQFAAYIEALLAGKEPPIAAAEARKSVELILAIYKSAREKREVKLPL